MWSAPAQSRRSLPDASATELFVLLHGMLFTNIQLDDFSMSLARFIERLEIEGAEEREWVMMAVINIGSILEYGKPTGILKKAGGVVRETGSAAAAVMRVIAKRELDEHDMDIDEPPANGAYQPSPAGSDAEADSLAHPLPFTLALQLTFRMLVFVLGRPTRKSSPFSRSTVNPYIAIVLTFLTTLIKHAETFDILESAIPWDDFVRFCRTIPRAS
jgi:hypothetical protein